MARQLSARARAGAATTFDPFALAAAVSSSIATELERRGLSVLSHITPVCNGGRPWHRGGCTAQMGQPCPDQDRRDPMSKPEPIVVTYVQRSGRTAMTTGPGPAAPQPCEEGERDGADQRVV